MTEADKKMKGLFNRLEDLFSTWKFPVFMISVLFFFVILIAAIAMIPVSDSALGSFAEDFKTWCLGYDPATGEMESIYVVVFIVQPIILSLFISLFWFKPLKDLMTDYPRKALPYITTAFIMVLAIGTTFPAFYSPTPETELPFPAEEIRTAIIPPDFTLINQYNEKVKLADYRGEVIMITSVYASCGETCPIILEQAKRVMGELTPEESADVHLMALTMDPDKDTPKMLKMTAEHYGLTEGNQHLLTGEPDYINTILDRLNIPRNRREDGAIDHANIFLIIDKKGTIAYRFTIGERQERWLLKATKLLVKEEFLSSTITADK